MKLYFRLLLTLIRSFLGKQVHPLDETATAWRVLPTDLDLYGHMNNGRYPMMMDLARVDAAVRSGLNRHMLKNSWIAPIVNSRMEFRASLNLFQSYQIKTKLVFWNDQGFYFRQEFQLTDQPQRVVAVGYVTVVVCLKPKKGRQPVRVPTQDVVEALGLQGQRPPLPASTLAAWGVHSPAIEVAEPTSMPTEQESIAIVGIGCRLPGGVDSADTFWNMLCEGRDCIVDIPADRWDRKRFHDPDDGPGRAYVHRAGILQHDIFGFDAGFFGMSPREADTLDPQQRLLLEVSWEAMEDARIAAGGLAGTQTGVFVGGFTTDSMLLRFGPMNRSSISNHTAASSTLTMLSNRLSYFYDFKGPSFSVDTACSSSLVAIHQACVSLQRGESDLALAGGVNLLLTPETHITMAKGRFLSRRGRCSAFSDQADGYVRGEGAALVVLKPLSRALADRNDIYAVIRGSAVNQDGRTSGITLPNGEAQQAAIRAACTRAGVDPSSIDYVEAHGTGTPAGDPIEACALGEVYGAERGAGKTCLVGSVKTNMGHLEGAAGVSGLIKAALCLKHQKVVPHLHLERVNPKIDLEGLHLRVPTAVESLLPGNTPFRAGVNSFGYGGTNAHVILEEAPNSNIDSAGDSAAAIEREPLTLPLSARSPQALSALATAYADHVDDQPHAVRTIARSAAQTRTHHRQRAFVTADDASGLVERLRRLASGTRAEGTEITEEILSDRRVVFVYTGMGPQWWAMGQESFAHEPVFRQAVEECDALFGAIAGWSIAREMAASESASRLTRTEIAQPANFVLQVALTRLLASWGVRADAVVGHSIGEVGSVWASGALSLYDALTVAYHRSRLQQRTAGKGGMLAVAATLDECHTWVERFGDIAIAAQNSAQAITLAGELTSLQGISEELSAADRFQKFLRVEVPYHSPAMDDLSEDLHQSLKDLRPSAPTCPIYSTVTGNRFGETPSERHDAAYWWRNVRGSVFFSDAIATLLDDDHRIFVEVGPHPVLATSLRELFRSHNVTAESIGTLNRKVPEHESLAQMVGRLYTLGVDPDWQYYYGKGRTVALPHYPWQRQHHWQETLASERNRLPHHGHPLVTSETDDKRWRVALNAASVPFLNDHRVAGTVLFPGAGHIELAAALYAAEHPNESPGISMEDLDLHAAVTASPTDNGHLLVGLNNGRYEAVHERGERDRVVSATARVFGSGFTPESLNLKALQQHLVEPMDADALYQELFERGLDYGPQFRAVQSLLRTEGEVLAQLELPEGVDATGYRVHPVLIDAALHALIAAAPGRSRHDIVPTAIERVLVTETKAAGSTLWAHGLVRETADDSILGDIRISDATGRIVVDIRGLSCVFMARVRESGEQRLARWCHQRVWRKVEPEATSSPATWLMVGGRPQLAAKNPLHQVTASAWSNDPTALLEKVNSDRPVRVLDLRWAQTSTSGSALSAGTRAATDLLETLNKLGPTKVERYYVVTARAESVEVDEAPRLDVAPWMGLARTAMSERPDLTLTTVDFDDIPADVSELLRDLERVGSEQETAYRGNELYALRIERGVPSTRTPAVRELADEPAGRAPAFSVSQSEVGKLDTLGFRACQRPVLGPDQVEIEVEYCSLHFKDLMKAMGLLSRRARANTYYGASLGMEGTGRICAVGENVKDIKVGDRVYAAGPFMQSHTTLHVNLVVPLPEGIDMADGASMITLMTVYHALVTVARVQPGEKLLIHSATGGVGLAAVEVGRWLGADIIATAGTEEKRNFLRHLGIDRVAHSRTADFAEDVLRWTNGEGVDVVLNFTPGEILQKNFSCLAPFGRFIELGKTAFDRDEPLPLRPFNENLTFASVDFDRILQSRPAYSAKVARTLFALLDEGTLKFGPRQVFPASQIDAAFSFMARGKHIGKLVLGLQDPDLTLQAPAGRRLFRADTTYVVTGGLGGFGLEVARWLAAHGARNLALVSRRGPQSTEAVPTLERLRADGVNAVAWAADLSDRGSVASMLDHVRATMPPIVGVFHGAMVLDDRRLEDLDAAAMEKVMGPKAAGAWYLHELTADDPLEHMVFFSSISSLVGNAGQGNYVAANTFLDQLACLRRTQGLPALSVNWGALGQVGVLARDSNVARHLERLGIRALDPDDALEALGQCLSADTAQLGLMDMNWSKFYEAVPSGAASLRYSNLLTAEAEQDGESSEDTRLAVLRAKYQDLDDEARFAHVQEMLVEAVAAVMKIEASELDPTLPLRDSGMDSLMAMEISAQAEQRVSLEIAAMDLASGPPVRDLARTLCQRIAEVIGDAEPAAPEVEPRQAA